MIEKIKTMQDQQCMTKKTLGGSSGREKYWSELDTDEKQERTRDQVKSLQREVRGLRNLVERLLNHAHDGQGRLVVPFHDSMGSSEGTMVRKDQEVYF